MIFLVQFGINKHSSKFFRLQIALALQAHAIFCSLWKICSCLFIPNCTRNHFFTYANRTRLHKIRRLRARNNYIQVSPTKIYHLVLRVEQETHNSSKNTTNFLLFVFQFESMLKRQRKVDIKLSKICQSHQKLSEWQKVASASLCEDVKMSESLQAIRRAICRALGFSY